MFFFYRIDWWMFKMSIVSHQSGGRGDDVEETSDGWKTMSDEYKDKTSHIKTSYYKNLISSLCDQLRELKCTISSSQFLFSSTHVKLLRILSS